VSLTGARKEKKEKTKRLWWINEKQEWNLMLGLLTDANID